MKRFIEGIRLRLKGGNAPLHFPATLLETFDSEISQVYITLFQRGLEPLRWGAKHRTLQESIEHVLRRLQSRPRFGRFDVGNPSACRIMVEMVTHSHPCTLAQLTDHLLTDERFEPGMTGLQCRLDGRTVYFMPTDAITRNVMSIRQMLEVLAGRFGFAGEETEAAEGAERLLEAPLHCALIRSTAFISFDGDVLPLKRGLPEPQPFSVAQIETTLCGSINWLADNMRGDGRFLYYYDPVADSEIDFQHPRMKNPTYYNILRHSGGTITLLLGYEHFGIPAWLEAARRSIDFFVTTLETHDTGGRSACYPFYNRKAKLGGAGIGLVALMHYERVSGDGRYCFYAEGLVRHILSRIEPDGEMLGYYLHLRYRGGAPLTELTAREKKELFSFYYPGEALLGLALFLRDGRSVAEDLKSEILRKSRLALDFLIHERPKKYSGLFEALPADSWLMQAIETWDGVADIVDDAHRAFVYGDAEKMMAHMYVPGNAPYEDYVGGFYYRYGDHVYHDGSRCEGLMAAYSLAHARGEKRKAPKIMNHMLLSARGLMLTYNSKESVYAHRFPERTVGSFRFKLTRQWVRVDSVQHTACFLARLFPLLK